MTVEHLTKPFKCSICGKPVEQKPWWGGGNLAWPVNDGRCCDHCDETVVLPARIKSISILERKKQHADKDR